jgi:regulator of RNase E activity RraA
MAGAEGLVTDGGIRDLDIVNGYGLKVFAGDRTTTGGLPEIIPYEDNVTVQCAGVSVRPGDLIVGDDDGVVVVANHLAAKVIDWVEEHEQVEEYIKGLIESEGVAPGKYYPITDETVSRYHRSREG